MSRTPRSYLWLLSPGKRSASDDNIGPYEHDSALVGSGMKTGRAALVDAMAVWGIRSDRVIFARRVSKVQHISRHAAADLFIDTLIYGAHSTATDALRGVSTACGYAFPTVVPYVSVFAS